MAQVDAAQAIAANQTGATEKKVAANRALELGSADAQRAIAEALAPRGDIDKQSLDELKEISTAVSESKINLDTLVRTLRENGIILTAGGK